MRIALIRLSSFGDILCTGPAVRAVSKRFPDAELVYITSDGFSDLAYSLPGVKRVISINKSGKNFDQALKNLSEEEAFDCVADLQGSAKSKKITKTLNPKKYVVDKPPRIRRSILLATRIRLGDFLPVPERMLKVLSPWGVKDDGQGLLLNMEASLSKTVLEEFGRDIDRALVLVPGAKHKTKKWPGEYWVDLIKKLEGRFSFVIIGSDEDNLPLLDSFVSDRKDCLNLCGKTGILEAAAVIEHASAVISGDTGPMHMAVALGKPLVAIFGPTVKEFGFYPFRAKRCKILEKEMWCRPCSAHGSAYCWLKHHKCLREISPQNVVEALDEILGVEEI